MYAHIFNPTTQSTRFDPDGEFIFGLWTALGSRERTGGKVRVQAGVDTAREQLGVIGGQPLDIEGEFRVLLQYENDLRDGVIGYTAVGRDRMKWRSKSKKPRGRSWMVKSMDRFDRIREAGFNPDEWIDWVERVKQVRDKFGKKSKEFLAVQRMTSGFLKKPSEFWEFKPTEESVQEYIKNADKYQASKGR